MPKALIGHLSHGDARAAEIASLRRRVAELTDEVERLRRELDEVSLDAELRTLDAAAATSV